MVRKLLRSAQKAWKVGRARRGHVDSCFCAPLDFFDGCLSCLMRMAR